MAKSLEKLQSLSVSECDKMEHIFHHGQGGDVKKKVRRLVPLYSQFLYFSMGPAMAFSAALFFSNSFKNKNFTHPKNFAPAKTMRVCLIER